MILNWNRADLTERAALSVLEDAAVVYLADNGSVEPDRRRLKSFAQEHGFRFLGYPENLGYASGNNRAIFQAIAEGAQGILLLNNDAEAAPGALSTLRSRLIDEPDVAAVQPTVLSMTTSEVLHTGCSLDLATGRATWLDRGLHLDEINPTIRSTDWVSGEAFLARSEVFREFGGFDPRYRFYCEDVDWSVRVRRQGWRLEVVPVAVVRHMVGGSMPTIQGRYYRARNQVLFVRTTLGASRSSALRRTFSSQAIVVGALAKRGHLREAMGGTMRGWVRGLLEAV